MPGRRERTGGRATRLWWWWWWSPWSSMWRTGRWWRWAPPPPPAPPPRLCRGETRSSPRTAWGTPGPSCPAPVRSHHNGNLMLMCFWVQLEHRRQCWVHLCAARGGVRGLEVVRAGAGAAGGRDGEGLQVQSGWRQCNTDYTEEAIFCSEYRVCAIVTKHSSLLCRVDLRQC